MERFRWIFSCVFDVLRKYTKYKNKIFTQYRGKQVNKSDLRSVDLCFMVLQASIYTIYKRSAPMWNLIICQKEQKELRYNTALSEYTGNRPGAKHFSEIQMTEYHDLVQHFQEISYLKEAF